MNLRTNGDIVATLIDTASGFALRTTFEDPGTGRHGSRRPTSRLLPAAGDLTIEAEMLRAGGRTGVTDVTIESANEDEPVAVRRTTYRLFREPWPGSTRWRSATSSRRLTGRSLGPT